MVATRSSSSSSSSSRRIWRRSTSSRIGGNKSDTSSRIGGNKSDTSSRIGDAISRISSMRITGRSRSRSRSVNIEPQIYGPTNFEDDELVLSSDEISKLQSELRAKITSCYAQVKLRGLVDAGFCFGLLSPVSNIVAGVLIAESVQVDPGHKEEEEESIPPLRKPDRMADMNRRSFHGLAFLPLPPPPPHFPKASPGLRGDQAAVPTRAGSIVQLLASLSSGSYRRHGAAGQEGGGADGSAPARRGDHALRQQLRLPGQPGHQEPLPELLPGVFLLAAVPFLVAPGVPALRQAEAGRRRVARAAGAARLHGRRPAGGPQGVQVLGEPLPQLPEARGPDGVPLPVRRDVLRRAPVLGPARLQLRLQVGGQGRHRPGEPRRARRQDR